MQLEQLVKILRESTLDEETKLFIIDLVAFHDDEHFVKKLMELILDWKKTDTEAVAILHDSLFALSEEHKASTEKREHTQHREALTIADAITREEKIQKIRDKILSV